jgi:hypothetical protein
MHATTDTSGFETFVEYCRTSNKLIIESSFTNAHALVLLASIVGEWRSHISSLLLRLKTLNL